MTLSGPGRRDETGRTGTCPAWSGHTNAIPLASCFAWGIDILTTRGGAADTFDDEKSVSPG